MKIAIIGYSGAGKSTLARALGEKYGCPVLHLDQVNFLPGWRERDRGEAEDMVSRVLRGKSWIIDGNYQGLLHQRRMDEAHLIYFLNFPRLTCLIQAYGRYLKNRGHVRDSAAPGCPEKFDFEFFRWLLWEGRTKERRQQFQAVCDRYPEKVRILTSRKETEQICNLSKL